ncbi:hypothetical protein BAR24_11805 [Gluconobacter oxydans]|nr:hypothetical protein BAR24_11805 [Gluconobacter oxydans]
MAANCREGLTVYRVNASADIRAFVNVIAIMEDEVDVLIRDGAPCGIIPELIVLAARSYKPDVLNRSTW